MRSSLVREGEYKAVWIINLCRDESCQRQNHAQLLLNLLLKGGH